VAHDAHPAAVHHPAPVFGRTRQIPPAYVRAARSAGRRAQRWRSWRVYLRQCVPRHERRRAAGVYPGAGLLHHAGPGWRRNGPADRATSSPTTSGGPSTGAWRSALLRILLAAVLALVLAPTTASSGVSQREARAERHDPCPRTPRRCSAPGTGRCGWAAAPSLVFLIAPVLVVVPLAFNNEPYFQLSGPGLQPALVQ